MIVNLEQGTEAWLKWRNRLVGGSDAPVVEEISPYRTLLQLFKEKRSEAVIEDDDSKEFIFERGHKTEVLIRKQFQELAKVEMAPVCMEHDKYDFMGCSLDGFDSRLGVLEAKMVGQEVLATARKNVEIPRHHMSQMQHQLEVSGADVGQWFGHDGKKDGVLIEVRANKEYIKALVEKEFNFWTMVKEGRTPPLSDRDYLIPEDLALLKALRDAKELAENAATAYENAKEHVINTFGGHPRIAGAGLKLFKVNRQGVLSLLKVPEIAKAVEDAKATLQNDYVEKFRGKPIESWTIRIDK